MKKAQSELFMVVLFTIFANSYFAQQKLREVIQETYKSRIFAVPIATDLNDLTQYDYTKMLHTPKEEITIRHVNSDSTLSVTKIFPQLPRWQYDYEFMIGRYEEDVDGRRMYDHKDSLLVEALDSNNTSNYLLSYEEINQLGLISIFDTSSQAISQSFISNGFTVITPTNNEIIAINDSLEILIDFSKLIYETRIFEDTLLQLSNWKQYQIVQGNCIPKVEVLTSYSYLSTGDRLQIAEITDYKKYLVIDANGDTLTNYMNTDSDKNMTNQDMQSSEYTESKKKNLDLIVYPNPAKDWITVKAPFGSSENLELQILDYAGNRVLSNKNIKRDEQSKIDISSLKSGLYFLQIQQDGKVFSKKMVKQ